jgi:hypothetical protein
MIILIVVAIGVLAYLFNDIFPQSTDQNPIYTPDSNSPATTIGAALGLTNFGPSQIATLADNAGFSGNDLAIAIAVALAESGGNPNAYNAETAAGTPKGKGSFGLWQIYLNAHPEFAGQNLYDPQTNANAAFSVYSKSGGNFQAWSTFKSGAYTNYIDVANAIIGA